LNFFVFCYHVSSFFLLHLFFVYYCIHIDTVASLVSTSVDPLSRTITCKTPAAASMYTAATMGWTTIELVHVEYDGKYNDAPTPFNTKRANVIPTRNELKFEFIKPPKINSNFDTCDSTTSTSATKTCDQCGTCGGTNTCETNTCDGNYDSDVDCAGICNGKGVIGTDNKCCEGMFF
jgi:hypothetical protein